MYVCGKQELQKLYRKNCTVPFQSHRHMRACVCASAGRTASSAGPAPASSSRTRQRVSIRKEHFKNYPSLIREHISMYTNSTAGQVHLTEKSSRACAPRLSLRASAPYTVTSELRIRFCSSRDSTRSVFQIIPRSVTCAYENNDCVLLLI